MHTPSPNGEPSANIKAWSRVPDQANYRYALHRTPTPTQLFAPKGRRGFT